MTGIVERLRQIGEWVEPKMWEHDAVALRAADEIEKLRGEVLKAGTMLFEQAKTIQSLQKARLNPLSCWQPIDTAPKDGTRVLVFADGEVECSEFIRGEWRDPYSDALSPQPTYWMHLPEPSNEMSEPTITVTSKKTVIMGNPSGEKGEAIALDLVERQKCRNDALEEAALVAERKAKKAGDFAPLVGRAADEIAAAIRALKAG